MHDAKNKADKSVPATDKSEEIRSLYLESLQLVERLHRRLLDVIKDEFDRNNRSDINAIQALLLFNIGDHEVTAGELKSRGYYQGSNVDLVIEIALREKASMIFCGRTAGSGVSVRMFGSVSLGLAQSAPVPTVIVP